MNENGAVDERVLQGIKSSLTILDPKERNIFLQQVL